ncbi:response regulator transcription factor [Numidum massiliense]|uniref:response regulator transcription factor n=1 Tax=Numidum massiliense TaxID=1522315 RepID=UPI0006D59A0D|nr:response regulator transcription factor [Numidum massiliense]
MSKHILVVDDDRKIAELLEVYLRNEGYNVHKSFDGADALATLEAERIDLMILDVMMPKVDGLEVCRQVRKERNLPILMLSAKVEDMDKILGLMTGADDYMVKPFNPLELVARVKALLRRAAMPYASGASGEASGDIRLHSLVINHSKHTVEVDGQPVNLTAREFAILYLLASHPGRVFSSEEIYERVWNESSYGSSKTVMVHISNLRDKLERATRGEKIIHTVWGVGYKVEK